MNARFGFRWPGWLVAAAGWLTLATAITAAEPAAPGPALEPAQIGAEWSTLFSHLAAQKSVKSTFVEERWFSVRKTPVILHGELRHSSAHGLSLHYVEPQDQTVIVDRDGLLLRDARGRSRSVPGGARNIRVDTVLLPVLNFDLPELRRYFSVHAAREGADWRLDFVPLSPELERQLGTVTVFGNGDDVRRLEFRRSATQRVIVRIEHTEKVAAFSAEELQRYFR